MTDEDLDNRRRFLKAAAGIAVASSAPLAMARHTSAVPSPAPAGPPRLRFGVIGLNHGHVYGQTAAVLAGGGELAAFHAKEDELAAAFLKRYPDARRVRDEREILEDGSVKLVVSASIPSERAPLGVRAMRHGKDFLVDKPGITTLEQLAEARRAQKETGRIFDVFYGESLENRAVVRANRLVRDGAIGRVIQVVGFGPHRTNPKSRPEWFWDPKYFGGILCDIASHQAYHFLSFTGSKTVEVVAAQVANVRHADRPRFQDFGDATWRGDGGTGYVRVDWFTPDGLPTWGDGRITILGTDGYVEIRSNVDIAGRKGGEHLFLVDQKETRHIDCSDEKLTFGGDLVSDVLDRTETAMPQARSFLAMELVLKAQAAAQRLAVPAWSRP